MKEVEVTNASVVLPPAPREVVLLDRAKVRKVENIRAESAERNRPDLILSISQEGMRTPIHVLNRGDFFEILRGHSRMAAVDEIKRNDPATYAKHFGAGIPAYVWTGLSPAQAKKVRDDHGEQLGLSAGEMTLQAVLLYQAYTEDGGLPSADALAQIVLDNYNTWTLHSNLNPDDAKALQVELDAQPSLLPLPKNASETQKLDYARKLKDFHEVKRAKVKKAILYGFRGRLQMVTYLASFPPIVLGLLRARVNQVPSDRVKDYLVKELQLDIPKWAGAEFPDVAGKNGTGNSAVLTALHKAWVKDDHSVGETFKATWAELAQVKEKKSPTGDRAKTLVSAKLKAMQKAFDSKGLKTLMDKVQGAETNDAAIKETDQILTVIDIHGGKDLAETLKAFPPTGNLKDWLKALPLA